MYAELMSLNKFQKLLSRTGLSFLFFVMIAVTGCETESQTPPPSGQIRKGVSSGTTELHSADTEKIIFQLEKNPLSKKEISESLNNIFGIHSVEYNDDQMIIFYDPLLFTGDSIRILLESRDIKIKD
jgi:hypothetical protein